MQFPRALGALACWLAVCSAQSDQLLITKKVYPSTCAITTAPFPSTGWIENNGTTTPYTFQTGLPTYAGNGTLAPTQTGGSAVETSTPGPIACPSSNATVYIPPGSNEGINGTGNYFIFCGVTYSGESIETLSGITTAEACVTRCSADNGCVAVAYDASRSSCLKKRSVVRNSDTPAPGSIFIFSLPYFTALEHQEPPVMLPTPSPSSIPPSYNSSAVPTASYPLSDLTSSPPITLGSTASATATASGNFSLTLPPLPDEPTLPWPVNSGPTSSRSLSSQTASPSVYLRTTISGGSAATTVIGGSTRTFTTASSLTTSVSGGYTTTYTTGGVTQVLTAYSAPTASASSIADAEIGPCPAYNGRQYTDSATGLTYLVSCANIYQGTTITTFYRSRLAKLAKRATADECAARCTIEPTCVAYTSYGSGQCTLYSEVTGQVTSTEVAYSAARIEPRVLDPDTPESTSFEPLLPQLTVTATDISTLPGSTREVTITQDASSFTYTTTLVSVIPASTIVTTDVVTTSLDGSTVLTTVELTTTLPASTSTSTQVVTTTAPGSLIVSTYVSVPPAVTVVTTMSAIVTTYVETITTQLPGSLIVSTEPATTVISTVVSTVPASTLTTTYSTTLEGSTILVTTSLPGETTTAVLTTREVSTEVRTSVITQDASTVVSYVTLTQTNTPAEVTYTPPAGTTLIETTIVSTVTSTIVSTQITTQPTTIVSTEVSTQPTTVTSTEITTQPTTIVSTEVTTQPTTVVSTASTTIVSTVIPSAYGLDAVPTCVSTGREYTAYDGSKFVMLCGLITVGTEMQTIATTSFSACVEICNQHGTSCAASAWDPTNDLCKLYSFMYLDFAHPVSGLQDSFTDSAMRLSGPQGLSSRSQIVTDGGFDSGLSSWTVLTPGRGAARVVGAQAQINVDNYRNSGPVVLSQEISAEAGSAYLLELRIGASGFSLSSLTGLQGVQIAVSTADGSFLGFHELQLGEESALHYAAGTFPREVTELRLQASCFNCGPEVNILLDDIALYVYAPGVGGFGVTATFTPAASTITQNVTVVSTELTTVPTTVVSTSISLEFTTVPSTVMETSLIPTTIVSTATPTPSNYGFNGYNTVPSCLPALNGQTYVAADESRFVMLCGHYIEGETLSSTPASSYSNCLERCNAELGCAGMEWIPDGQHCQLYLSLTDAYAPSGNALLVDQPNGLTPPTLRDAAIRLSGPGGPTLSTSLLTNGGFDDALVNWTAASRRQNEFTFLPLEPPIELAARQNEGPANTDATVVDGAATLTYTDDLNTISLSQRIQGNVGDGFALALRLSAGGTWVRQPNQFPALPFVEVTAYLDNQLIGSFVTIQGDPATLVYAGGRLQTSATLLTVVARIRSRTGLTAILDDISLSTWATENSQNSLCTNDGGTYTSTTDGSQFVMLCSTGLDTGTSYYQTTFVRGYSQCVELCAQQGTICAGAVWQVDPQQCVLYDRSGLQGTGSASSERLNSAIRLTGPPDDENSYRRTQQLLNGGFDTGTYSSWEVEDQRSGDLDVSANLRNLTISTLVDGGGYRIISQEVSGAVGDTFLLTFTVSIPSDVDYEDIVLRALLDDQSLGTIYYDPSDLTGSRRTSRVYASGTFQRPATLLRLRVDLYSAAWITLDDVAFYTYGRSSAVSWKPIISGASYSFDDYAVTTYTTPQVIAGQTFRLELNDVDLVIPSPETICKITLSSGASWRGTQTVLFGGTWGRHTAFSLGQYFVSTGTILSTTTEFHIDFLCKGSGGNRFAISYLNFYVDTPLEAPYTPSERRSTSIQTTPVVPQGKRYQLTAIAYGTGLPAESYCSLYLGFDQASEEGKIQTTMPSNGYTWTTAGVASYELSTLMAAYACYGGDGYIPATVQLQASVVLPKPSCEEIVAEFGAQGEYGGKPYTIQCNNCYGSYSVISASGAYGFAECMQACSTTPNCRAVQYYGESEGTCYLLSIPAEGNIYESGNCDIATLPAPTCEELVAQNGAAAMYGRKWNRLQCNRGFAPIEKASIVQTYTFSSFASCMQQCGNWGGCWGVQWTVQGATTGKCDLWSNVNLNEGSTQVNDASDVAILITTPPTCEDLVAQNGAISTYGGKPYQLRCDRCYGSGTVVTTLGTVSFQACMERCSATEGCLGVQQTYASDDRCYLFKDNTDENTYNNVVCDVATIIPPPPTCPQTVAKSGSTGTYGGVAYNLQCNVGFNNAHGERAAGSNMSFGQCLEACTAAADFCEGVNFYPNGGSCHLLDRPILGSQSSRPFDVAWRVDYTGA